MATADFVQVFPPSAEVGGASATVDRSGPMPALAYQSFVDAPATDPTATVETTGTTSATHTAITGLTSTIDPAITTISARWTRDGGHYATGLGVPLLLFSTFTGSETEYTDAYKARLASYVAPTGRAFIPCAMTTRGRGAVGGTIDHRRDTQDADDVRAALVTAIGANLHGEGGACLLGISTGALDAMLYTCRYPDRVRGIVLHSPNFDLGLDLSPGGSYWSVVSSALRTTITGQMGNRMTAGKAAVDPYLVADVVTAFARVLALPNSPHCYLFADTEDPEALPDVRRLVRAIQAVPGAGKKFHVYLSTSASAHRWLHGNTLASSDQAYSERYWVQQLLASEEWNLPQAIGAPLRMLGHFHSRGDTSSTPAVLAWKAWCGTDASNAKLHASGGMTHAGDLVYDSSAGVYQLQRMVTSTTGYLEVSRGAQRRLEAITVASGATVNLDEILAVTNVATQLGFTGRITAAAGVTEAGGAGTGVTTWADQIGSFNFTGATNLPVPGTDADGKAYVGFASASSQRLQRTARAFDPMQDFTLCVVAYFTSGSVSIPFSMGNSSDFTEVHVQSASGSYEPQIQNASDVRQHGLIGMVLSNATKHFLSFVAEGQEIRCAINGQTVSRTTRANAGTFSTLTRTILGGRSDGTAGFFAGRFFNGRLFEAYWKQAATSEVDIAGCYLKAKSDWTLP